MVLMKFVEQYLSLYQIVTESVWSNELLKLKPNTESEIFKSVISTLIIIIIIIIDFIHRG